jgi:hypothetical protein
VNVYAGRIYKHFLFQVHDYQVKERVVFVFFSGSNRYSNKYQSLSRSVRRPVDVSDIGLPEAINITVKMVQRYDGATRLLQHE